MPFRCKQAFPREEKCLLDLLRSVLQSFIGSFFMRLEKGVDGIIASLFCFLYTIFVLFIPVLIISFA
jgi:hypothetical protein